MQCLMNCWKSTSSSPSIQTNEANFIFFVTLIHSIQWWNLLRYSISYRAVIKPKANWQKSSVWWSYVTFLVICPLFFHTQFFAGFQKKDNFSFGNSSSLEKSSLLCFIHFSSAFHITQFVFYLYPKSKFAIWCVQL